MPSAPDGGGAPPGGDAEGRESAAPSVRPTPPPPPRRAGSEDRNGPSNPQDAADAGPDGALRGDDPHDAGGKGDDAEQADAEREMVCDCAAVRAELEGRLDRVRGWRGDAAGSEDSRRRNWQQLLEPIRAASEVLKRSLDGTIRRGDRFRIVESLCTVSWAAERAFHGSAGTPGMSRLFIQQFGPSLDLQMKRWHDPIAELFAAVNRGSPPRLADPSPHFLFRQSVQEAPRGGPSQGQAIGRRQNEPRGPGMQPLASSDGTVLMNLADRLRGHFREMVGPSGRAPDRELAACIATAFPSPQARRDVSRGGDAAVEGDPSDAGTAIDPDPSSGDEPPDGPIPPDAGGAAPPAVDPPPGTAPPVGTDRTLLDALS
jgi:hypothetical protein